jgi:spore coat protein U-like protein
MKAYMNRKFVLAALVASAFTASAATAATTAGDDFLVKIVLTNSCTIVADDLDFGTPANLSANINVNTAVHVTCSGANPVSVDFNAGSSAGSTIASREMDNGAGGVVTYNIYTDNTYATPLGQTAATNTIDFTSTGNGATDNKTVYGRVPAQAAKPNGTYTSTVRATVTF